MLWEKPKLSEKNIAVYLYIYYNSVLRFLGSSRHTLNAIIPFSTLKTTLQIKSKCLKVRVKKKFELETCVP
jgi:hypothetical protein